MTDDEIINKRIAALKNRKIMVQSIKQFVKGLKTGKHQFPQAIDILNLVRQDRAED